MWQHWHNTPGRSLTIIRNRKGPITEPCWNSLGTDTSSDSGDSSYTFNDQLARKEVIHAKTFECTPRGFSLSQATLHRPFINIYEPLHLCQRAWYCYLWFCCLWNAAALIYLIQAVLEPTSVRVLIIARKPTDKDLIGSCVQFTNGYHNLIFVSVRHTGAADSPQLFITTSLKLLRNAC